MANVKVNIAGDKEYPLVERPLRLMAVGAPGTNKVRFGSQFPDPIFAHCGLETQTSLSRLGLPFVRIRQEKDLFYLSEALDNPDREQLFGRNVRTLVINTIDGLQRTLMASRLEREGRSETEVGDWGWIATRLERIFDQLVKLDLNLVVLCNPKEVTFNEHRSTTEPGLGGSFAKSIHDFMDASILLQAFPNTIPQPGDTGGAVETNEQTGEILISGSAPETRFVMLAAPQASAEWVHDKTGMLPARTDITELMEGTELNSKVFGFIYNALFSTVELPESQEFNIGNAGVLPPATPATATEVPVEVEVDQAPEPAVIEEPKEVFQCTGCGDTFDERAWSDLSQLKFQTTLCGTCFKSR